MAINFEKAFDAIKGEVKETIVLAFNEYAQEAASDADKMLLSIKEDLKTWTLELANGELTKDEYEFLLKSKKDLVEMNVIKQAGLTLIQKDELKNKIFNSIVKVVSGLI